MQPFRYILLPTLSFLLIGCQKDEVLESCPGSCTTVRGQLVTAGGSQALAGVAVTAEWNDNQGAFGGGSYHTKARTTTDAAGNYQLTFFVKDEELKTGFFRTHFTVDKQRYYTIGEEDMGPFYWQRDSTYQMPLYLIPYKATATVIVTNPSQIKGYYSVELNSSHGPYFRSGPASGGGSALSFNSPTNPYPDPLEVAANQKLYVRTSKPGNGSSVRTLDSLTIPAGTHRTISITY